MPKKEANDLKIAIKSCFTTLVEDTTLIQNAATPYPVEFAFSKDWDGFAKTALFEAGGVSMAVVLSEDKFATDVTDDNVVNSYKELIDWVAKHGPEATKMAGGISENKTAIADLKTLVGTLPEGATSTTVVAYIAEAINALSIGDYAKTTEVTAAISTALKSYYTKTQVDETFVKKTDIVMATDAEVDAMLTEVFGAQATV